MLKAEFSNSGFRNKGNSLFGEVQYSEQFTKQFVGHTDLYNIGTYSVALIIFL